jgi:phage shock protein PspC (stress-responsive transcriptional regulator)
MVSEAALPALLDRGRLRRRTEHRLVAGVAGGIADRLNAPVAFIRFFIGLAFLWAPWTAALYAAAALLLPATGRDRPDWDNLVAAGRLGLVFAVPWLALPQVFVNQPIHGSPGWFIAVYGLLGVGAVLLFSADYRRGRPRSREEARATVLAALPVAACAALVMAGIVLVPHVRWEQVVPLVAVVGGVALLARGRREHVAPMMLALAAAAVVVASGARLEGGVGDVRVAPREPPADRIVVRRAVGDVEVDLRRLRRSAAPVDVEVSVGRGGVDIEVPRGASVDVDARVGSGELEVWHGPGDERRQGLDQRLDAVRPGRPDGLRVRVLASVGKGSLYLLGAR